LTPTAFKLIGGFVFVCVITLLAASAIRHGLIEPVLMNEQCLNHALANKFACALRAISITAINLPLLPYLPLLVLLLTLKWYHYWIILVATIIASFGLILYHPEPSAIAIVLAGLLLSRAATNANSPGRDIKSHNPHKASA
jgi:hypothetical protein